MSAVIPATWGAAIEVPFRKPNANWSGRVESFPSVLSTPSP
jgi:hypothetical protein